MRRTSFFSITVIGVLLFPGDAFAWGAGIHISQGSFILNNLAMIRPEIAGFLMEYPLDYLYGCVSADIFIGKGYQRRDDHCHNWSVGFEVLKGAEDEKAKAYAYGYMSHLAADVIAHNYLIPNMLYSTPTSKRLGHVYWEYRADRLVKKDFWKLASEVVTRRNKESDTLIKQVVSRNKLGFSAKKMVFARSVHLTDLTIWREKVESSYNGDARMPKKYVIAMNNLAINLIIDLLVNMESAVCLGYDPVGTDNTINSKSMRRNDKRRGTHDRSKMIFPPPDDIRSLDYVDEETVRL